MIFMNMKKKITALLAAAAVSASAMPVSVFAADDIATVLKEYAEVFLAEGENPNYVWENNLIQTIGDVEVDTDMKAAKAGSQLKDKVKNNTYSAGTDLKKKMKFDYATTMKMQNVLDEYNNVTALAKTVIAAECLADTDAGVRKASLEAQLAKSYIKDGEFIVTISNPDGMEIPNEAINGTDMFGFTAVKGDEVIEPDNGKITISTPAGDLVYYEKADRTYENKTLTITIGTEGIATHAALAEALKYDLVLACEDIEAVGPSSYSSSETYKLVGDVTGNTPIYVPSSEDDTDTTDDVNVAKVTYKAVQDESSTNIYETTSEISEKIKITTDRKPGGGGGGLIIPPSVPTATPEVTTTPEPTLTPTFAPDQIIPVPGKLNADDHVAYIIGYPEGDVRPENNISREEVATVFYRLLTDEARSEMLDKENEYPDVEVERWSNNAISTLDNGGIIKGYEDGTFRPAASITRAEFVTIAVRFYEHVTAGDAGFTDVDGHWAKDNINTAVFYRLIDGYEDGTFKPDKAILRSEAMTIFNHILNRHVTKEGLIDEAVQNNWIDNPESAWYYTEVLEATMTHDYTRPENTLDETWTALKENPDWVELEKTYTSTGTEHIE